MPNLASFNYLLNTCKHGNNFTYFYSFPISAAIASCVEGASATEIIATFRVDKKTVDLTEATAYSQDGATAQTGVCTVGFTGNIAELVLTFDTTGALPCGIEQVCFSVVIMISFFLSFFFSGYDCQRRNQKRIRGA